MDYFDILADIEKIVDERTRFLRHYWGRVERTDDAKRRGRVLVTIPMLGWSSEDSGAWAEPRDKHSMVVPKEGEHVEVYFMEGNPDRPVYMGQVHEIDGNTPGEYSGPQTVVIHEDPDGGFTVVLNKDEGGITIEDGNGNEIELGSDGVLRFNGDQYSFVKHEELEAAKDTFMSSLNSHVHTKVTSGSEVTGSIESPLTFDISGAATDNVKHGG